MLKKRRSIKFINNELFIYKRFVNNSEFKYGEKAERVCKEFCIYVRSI